MTLTSPHTYSSTVEQYIKCIFLLDQSQKRLKSMRAIAQEMQIAPSTATAMMQQLERAGLVSYIRHKGVRLTDKGETLALHMIRRHRLIETFLAKVLKYNLSEVHADAEQLEHAVSDVFIEKISAYMNHPTKDPHGAPIPAADGHLDTAVDLLLTDAEPDKVYRIQRIASDSAVVAKEFEKQNICIGMRVQVIEKNIPLGVITFKFVEQNRTISISTKLAALIFLAEY